MSRRPYLREVTGPRHGISPPLTSTPLPPEPRAWRCDGATVHHISVGPLDPFGEPQDVIEVPCDGCPDCRHIERVVVVRHVPVLDGVGRRRRRERGHA